MSALSYDDIVQFICVNRGNGLTCKDGFFPGRSIHGAWRGPAKKAGWSKLRDRFLCPDCTKRKAK